MQDEENAHSESSQEENTEDVVSGKDPSDELTPEHPRFKAVLERAKKAEEKAEMVDELKEELERLKSRLDSKPEEKEDYSDAEQEALDKIERAFKRRGYVTQEELENRERILRREQTYKELKGKYENMAGYPKFDPLEVQAFAKKNGFGENLEAAYKTLHMDAIIKAESKRSTLKPPTSESPTGGEREVDTGLTLDKIQNMSLDEYSKHEDAIDRFMKRQAGLIK